MPLEDFLRKENVFAVVGASGNTEKWGYKVFKMLKNAGYEVYPVNPNRHEIDGEKCYPSLYALPKVPDVVVTVVKPEITESVVKECKELGIKKVWMQPGSESEQAVKFCIKNGIEAVYGICLVRDVVNKF